MWIHFELWQIDADLGLLPGQPVLAHATKLYRQLQPPARTTWSQLGWICGTLKGFSDCFSWPFRWKTPKIWPGSLTITVLIKASFHHQPCQLPPVLVSHQYLDGFAPKSIECNSRFSGFTEVKCLITSTGCCLHPDSKTPNAKRGSFTSLKIRLESSLLLFPAKGSSYNNIILHCFLA